MRETLFRVATRYLLPVLSVLLFFFFIAMYLSRHGALLPDYNR